MKKLINKLAFTLIYLSTFILSSCAIINSEAKKIFDKYLDDLTTGINNLYIMSDGDVIVGGPVAVYLEKYKDIISKMLIDKCSFDIDGSYLSFAKCTQQQADSGAALTFFSDFISQI